MEEEDCVVLLRDELRALVRDVLDSRGKQKLVIGDDALEDISRGVDQEVSDLFRRSNLVRKLGGGEEKEVTLEHVKIAWYTNELLHSDCNEEVQCDAVMKRELVDVLMADDDAEKEVGGCDENDIERVLSRQEAIALERRKYKYQLLTQHRKRVACNAQEITVSRLKKVKLV